MIHKRLLIAFIAGSLVAPAVTAQVAKWVLRPEYDEIRLLDCGLYQVREKSRVGLIDDRGRNVLPVEYDSIMPFADGHAALIKEGQFVAVTDESGHTIDVTAHKYKLVPGAGFYSSGQLLVKKDNNFYFINTVVNKEVGPFASAYPFFEGKAVVRSFSDENIGELQYNVLDPTFEIIPISGIEPKEVAFISSFNNDKAVCVAKKKVYIIDGESMVAVPLATDPANVKKTTVEVERKDVHPAIEGGGGYAIGAKNGLLHFDSAMRLRRTELLGQDPVDYGYPASKEVTHESNLAKIGGNGSFGLNYKGATLLPPQFDDVMMLRGNMAVVKQNGYYGIVSVDPDSRFVLKLNDNEPMGFNHQFFDGKLTMHMPSYIKCGTAKVIDRMNNCEIQVNTRKENENVEGNTLFYDCRVKIPDDLTDSLKPYEYSFAIRYDGLLSVDQNISSSAWYVKNYEVTIANTEFLAGKDMVSVEFDLKSAGIGGAPHSDNYFRKVEVMRTDLSAPLSLDKITEDRYSFNVGSLTSDKATFEVKITEAGCPSLTYPFELVLDRTTGKAMALSHTGRNMLEPEIMPEGEVPAVGTDIPIPSPEQPLTQVDHPESAGI